MGARKYTDAQRDEAAWLYRESGLSRAATVKMVAKATGMSETTVRTLAEERGLTKNAAKGEDAHGPANALAKAPAKKAKQPTGCAACRMATDCGGGSYFSPCPGGKCMF